MVTTHPVPLEVPVKYGQETTIGQLYSLVQWGGVLSFTMMQVIIFLILVFITNFIFQKNVLTWGAFFIRASIIGIAGTVLFNLIGFMVTGEVDSLILIAIINLYLISIVTAAVAKGLWALLGKIKRGDFKRII